VRFFLPILSLSVAVLSILVDFAKPSPAAGVCAQGLCRFDQMYSKIDSDGADNANLAALLMEDPSNPSAWCTYAERLAQTGNVAGAQGAFAHAVSLGPGMAPVLMRAANFDFSQGQWSAGFALSKRVLAQTGAFDQVVFSYLPHAKIATPQVLESALPAQQRSASAWLAWLKENGSDQDVLDTWQWMRTHRLDTRASALELTWTLWARRRYALSQQLWSDWLGAERGDYLNPQRLFNRRFQSQPNTSPFDWTLEGSPSVGVSRGSPGKDGIEVRFAGTENVAFSGLHQFTTLPAGHYHFAAEIETHDLTTDQRPLFHIVDVEPRRKIDVSTQAIAENAGRSWITLDFDVPPAAYTSGGAQAIEIALERYASGKYDNKIAGILHIYQVSLTRE
jgi:hypothetical protein